MVSNSTWGPDFTQRALDFWHTYSAEHDLADYKGQVVEEDAYAVDFPFDGQVVNALATFVPSRQILVGTRMMKRHELRDNFVTQRLSVTRA
jgi:hypothetical protein